MSLIDTLPIEIYNKILFLSVGAHSLYYNNLKNNMCKELHSYDKTIHNGFYLNLTANYEITPELDMDWNDYIFAKRIPKLMK